MTAFRWPVLIRILSKWRSKKTEGVGAFARHEVRYDGLSFLERLDRLFDPDLKGLTGLAVGFFDTKVLFLPSSRIPTTEEGLFRQCRKLIDHGEDALHIELILKNFPGGWSLERHVQDVWRLREIHFRIFCDVVQGIHGRAQATFKKERPQGLNAHELNGMLARHGLLLSALDAQMAIVGARETTEAPFGPFLDRGTQVVGGTVLRLMRETLDPIEESEGKFQTFSQLSADGRHREKMQNRDAKVVADRLKYSATPLASFGVMEEGTSQSRRRALDYLGRRFGWGRAQGQDLIDQSAHYNLANGMGEPKADNTLRTFHQIWFSDLPAVAAAGVSLLRFAMAEQAMEAMVDRAFGKPTTSVRRHVGPIPPPPAGLDRQSPLILRVLDLLDSARRTQLRDPRYKARTPKNERDLGVRDPEDMAGLTAVMKAYEFLQAAGVRQFPFDHLPQPHRGWHETYYHLDVVPDVRLNLLAEPDLSFLG